MKCVQCDTVGEFPTRFGYLVTEGKFCSEACVNKNIKEHPEWWMEDLEIDPDVVNFFGLGKK